MTGGDDRRQHVELQRRRIAEAAERLARAEGQVAKAFERLARLGGEQARRRQALADDARRRKERLAAWVTALRGRGDR